MKRVLSDAAILEFASGENYVCVTLDHDFHTHLALSLANGPSVVFLRVTGWDASRQVDLIERVWLACEGAMDSGIAVSTDKKAIRFRKLPLR